MSPSKPSSPAKESVTRPRRSPDDVRERVLEAARVCFHRSGVMATRMDEVADEAGLLRPNLYRYFASRDALIGAVIVREIEMTNAIRRQSISMRGPIETILVEALAMGYEIARSDEMTQLLLVDEMRATTSAIATAEESITSAEMAYWVPVLAYGRSRNEINASMSDIRIVRWFLTMQVLLSARDSSLAGLASDARNFFADFVVPPVLNRAGA